MNPTTSQVVTNQASSGATPTPTTPTAAGEIEFFVARTEGERAKLDALGAGFDTASTDGDGNYAAAADVNENAAGGCCSTLSPTLLSVKYPVLFAILNAAIYYADFGTDLSLAVKANRECNVTDATMEDPPTVLPYIIIVVIGLHPIVMSAADLLAEGGMGWFGVLLNLTNTRMLYALYKAVAGGSQKNAVAAAKSANDVKLFEAVLESMPQAHLQFIYLLYYPDCVGGERDLIVSLAISTLSIVFALATKFEQLFDKAGKAWFMLAAWLYFASDAVSRGLAVAMVFGALGGGGVAAFAGGWVVLDLVGQWLGERGSWGDVEHGRCGMRCCWDEYNGGCCRYGIFDCRDGWGTRLPPRVASKHPPLVVYGNAVVHEDARPNSALPHLDLPDACNGVVRCTAWVPCHGSCRACSACQRR